MGSLIYYLICFVGLCGGLVIAKETYRWELLKARRWRKVRRELNLKNYKICRWYFNLVEKSRREKADIEIYEAISFMRNIIAIGKGGSHSSNSLIEELIQRRGNPGAGLCKDIAPFKAKSKERRRGVFCRSHSHQERQRIGKATYKVGRD